MGAGYHGGFVNTKGSQMRSKKLHEDRQGKHIVGHKNYVQGKSEFLGSLIDAKKLIENYSGTGKKLKDGRERVDFHKVIGYYVDFDTGEKKPTTMGIIHYSKDGAHIVPSRPKEG